MRLIQFDDAKLPSAQAKYDVEHVAEHLTVRAIGARAGAFDLYGASSPLQDVSIGYEFLFTGGDRTLLDELLGKVGRRANLIASMTDGSRRRTTAKLVSAKDASDGEHEMPVGLRRVQCQFAASPIWLDDVATQIDLSASTMAVLVNEGNHDCLCAVFTFLNALGAGVTITNNANAQWFSYGATTSGTLAIDVGAGTVLHSGANAYGNTSRPDTQIEFLAIAPGVNVLTFSAAVSGTIEYRGAWR